MEVLITRPAAKSVFNQQIHRVANSARSFGNTFSVKGVKENKFYINLLQTVKETA